MYCKSELFAIFYSLLCCPITDDTDLLETVFKMTGKQHKAKTDNTAISGLKQNKLMDSATSCLDS